MKNRPTIRAVLAGLCLACLPLVGCRILTDASRWEFGSFSETPTPATRLTDAIADAIDTDAWIGNPNWSPVTEEHSPLRSLRYAPPGQRWLFRPVLDSADRNKLLSSVQQNQSERSPPDNAPFQTFSGLSQSGTYQIEDVVAAFDPQLRNPVETNIATSVRQARASPETGPATAVREAAIKHLATVAMRDNLSGWNATILLAQRSPRAAQPFVSVLARLVADPPRIETTPDDASNNQAANNQAANMGKTKSPQKGTRPISGNMRAAAAEAWCLVLATAQTDAETAMWLPGHVLEDMHRGVEARQLVTVGIPLMAEAELIRGLGRRVAPARIRRLENHLMKPLHSGALQSALRRRRDVLRRAAMDACVLHAIHLRGFVSPNAAPPSEPRKIDLRDATLWPQALWESDGDPDPSVRVGYGLLLAVARDPRAADDLTSQIADTNTDVQRRALRNLGLLQSEAARNQLREYMLRKSLLRKTALQGLAAYGEAELIKYVSDEDAGVREELARQLTQFQSRRSAFALVSLLTDRVPSVQQASLKGLEGWPDDLLLPLLLHGAVDGSFQTRSTSLSMLRARTGNVSAPFRADDTQQLRQNRAAVIAQRWRIAFPLMRDPIATTPKDNGRPDVERVAEIESRLRRVVGNGSTTANGGFESEWFHRLDASDLAALEQALKRSSPAGQGFLFREVLPRLHPEYEALALIEDSNLEKRRQGAKQLRGIGWKQSLRDTVLDRLATVLVREEDVLVWRGIIAAVEKDGTEQAGRIVQLAVNHRWPDVRLAGCRYVAKHGRPDYGIWMQRLFQDSNPAVQLAAIQAAGRCGNQRVLEDVLGEDGKPTMIGLRRLLTAFSGSGHLAVVASMSRLLDPMALDELNRLSHSGSWRTRVAAIQVMGETGQTRFLDRLIDILWLGQEARPEVQNAAFKAIEMMIPSDERPSELQTAKTAQQRAALWHTWWQKRSGGDRRTHGPAVTPTHPLQQPL